MNRPDTRAWLTSLMGRQPDNEDLFTQALTHGSAHARNYERLEFLGDRVLGMVMAQWLFETYPSEPEGKLSRRLNALVTGETCAQVGRSIGLPPHLRLGKQARDDGAMDSDNVLGDVVEALIGALYLDAGMDAASTFVKSHWADKVTTQENAPRHPKSALQEWAAANRRKPPEYILSAKSGPAHNPRFIVTVSIKGVGEASAEGSSKQEAETAAAKAMLEGLS